MQRYVFWCLACATFLAVSTADAATVSYQFAFDQSNYLVLPWEKVDVAVYLKETVGDGGVSVLKDPDGAGMFGAGVKVRFDVPPQPSNPAKVALLTDITGNSAFDMVTPSVTGTDAKLALAAFENPYVYGFQPDLEKEEYWLLLGTFSFTAGATPSQVTPILATAYGGDVNITGLGESLDGSIQEGNATIATIPEPSALLLSVIAALTLFASRCLARLKEAGRRLVVRITTFSCSVYSSHAFQNRGDFP